MAQRKYRVWTANANNTVSIMTDWQSYAECRKFIIGRWRHWPPFAYISQAKTERAFRVYNNVRRM